ncbi:unnamed protein product [Ceutorhynchus assimilis]|uniref:BPTI/Kunitz inhibitor domain-containing protein n=1 Tax=Ceutorhynchus assimilis TaxID=467358 RepID=A0A9N9QLC4_9CUCU|nr:unnamed protein product [Ceutorhynchus assimilis]
MRVFTTLSVYLCLFLLAAVKAEFTLEDCDKPHTWGPVNCNAYFEIYHWNNTLKKCEKAIYGGCRATNNNFKTLKECERVATRVCIERDY